MPDFRFKYFLTFLLVFFAGTTISGQELFLEWAVPLKKNLVQLNRREQGGVTAYGKDILVSTRDGNLHLFSEKGKNIKTIQFDGEFYFSPEISANGNVLVCVSNSIFMLDNSLNMIWNVSGKAAVASKPLVTEDSVFVQFHDNSIYVLNKETGAIKTAYTYYSDEEVSFLRLSRPFISEDKIVFGFSSGMIIYFMHRKSGSVEELVPYFKFKTSSSSKLFDKKEFYDLLTIIPYKDTILFSGGEYGGSIIDGKVTHLENMKNLHLISEESGGFTGYGEGGIFSFNENGVFNSKLLKSANYVSNLVKSDAYAIATTTGEGSILGYSEGYIYLMSSDYSKILHSVMIPNGISSEVAKINNSLYLISDMGVLYKFKVVK